MEGSKRAGGCPTKYDPAYCDKVIELGKQGKSITQMACAIGVVKKTIYNWEKEHPEFLHALTRARQYAQGWWEDVGQNALYEKYFQSSLWAKQVTCRFPDDYKEKKESDLNVNIQSHEDALEFLRDNES